MTDTSPEAILAAVKQTEYKYFGDYELSTAQIEAVEVLVAASLKLATADLADSEMSLHLLRVTDQVADAHAAGKAEGLREAAVIAQGRWQTWTSGCEVSCDVTACENIATAILARIPATTGGNDE
jgi:hypothetical protein